MRFLVGVASAGVGWAAWLAIGGVSGLVAGAFSLSVAHVLGVALCRKIRKPQAGPGLAPYLTGWLSATALLLGVAFVVVLMGVQLEAEHERASQLTMHAALMRDYPGKGMLEFGMLLVAAGLAMLVEGMVRWVEYRLVAGAGQTSRP